MSTRVRQKVKTDTPLNLLDLRIFKSSLKAHPLCVTLCVKQRFNLVTHLDPWIKRCWISCQIRYWTKTPSLDKNAEWIILYFLGLRVIFRSNLKTRIVMLHYKSVDNEIHSKFFHLQIKGRRGTQGVLQGLFAPKL